MEANAKMASAPDSGPFVQTRRPSARRVSARRGAAALLWCLIFLGLGWVGMSIHLEWYPRYLRDPEYGTKTVFLRHLQARSPGRPLVVVLGSSRCSYGIRPDAFLAAERDDPTSPIVFNLALFGSGPLMELLCLNRLLADGIRPDVVLVEYWAPSLEQEDDWAEEKRIDPSRLSWVDVRLLSRYWSDPQGLRRQFEEERLEPFFSYRFAIVSRLAEAWLPVALRRYHPWNSMDAYGWLPNLHDPNTSPEERARRLVRVAEYYRPLLQRLQVSPIADRALREMLDVCRRERIGVVLFQMPEGSEFRALYPPAARAEADRYLSRLVAEYGVPVLDARCWAPDHDFSDSFHLLPEGAAAFSRRLGTQALPVIRDLLRSRG